MLRRKICVTSAKTNPCNICAKNAAFGIFRADATQKKSTDATQKDLCTICESESVYNLREKCSKWKQLPIGIPSHLDDLQRIMVTD